MTEEHPDFARMRALTGVKWSRYPADVIPCWVADMDLPPFPGATQAVVSMAERGDFGYCFAAHGELPGAFVRWQERHHGWAPDTERARVVCDVLQAVDLALMLRTSPGDGVVLFTPVYPPFFGAVTKTGRRVIDVPLEPGTWRLDPERLASAIDGTTTAILMCNPHNPSGRAFSAEELAAIAEVAEHHDLLVISDEIWGDLVYEGHRHIPFATVSTDAAARTVTATSASKTFNLAGLRCAVMHVGDDATLAGMAALPGHLLGAVGSPGAAAMLAAWTEGDEWLSATRGFLQAQRDHVLARLGAELPGVAVSTPEATYLAWLDLRPLGLGDDPAAAILDRARVALSSGTDFGPHGAGFARLNFATTRAVLDAALDRLADMLG